MPVIETRIATVVAGRRATTCASRFSSAAVLAVMAASMLGAVSIGESVIGAGSAAAQGTSSPQGRPSAAAAQSQPTLPELGVWIDDTGKGAVEIAPCGDKLCGMIVWLDPPVDAKGHPLTDGNNPDKAKRVQPVCGLQVIGNLVRQNDGSWDKGWVYDPKTGDRYDLAMRMTSPDRLAITGYVGVKLLSETFTWVRAPSNPPLPKCSAQTSAQRH